MSISFGPSLKTVSSVTNKLSIIEAFEQAMFKGFFYSETPMNSHHYLNRANRLNLLWFHGIM